MAEAIYIHIPFCASKCHYCDFTSYAGLEHLYAKYAQALIAEISTAESAGEIASIYLGGGTPTLLADCDLIAILAALQGRFRLSADVEITLEANPGTVDRARLDKLRQAGVNRLSLGVQALQDDLLKSLGRIHTAKEGIAAFRAARQAGFDNISIDVMYALPGQDMSEWQETLRQALSLGAEHISLYELTIEEGTPFFELAARGELPRPSEEVCAQMYEQALDLLAQGGYEHYEISNFAKPHRRARHSLIYWKNEPYYGFGAGATRYLDGVRCRLTTSVPRYIEAVGRHEDPAESCERLSGAAAMGETVMLGLRMLEGVDLPSFERRFGVAFTQVYKGELARLLEEGMVEISARKVRLTRRGLLWANQVTAEFLSLPQE